MTPSSLSRCLFFAGLGFLGLSIPARAGVSLTEKGFSIDAGSAGVHLLTFPRPLTANDQKPKSEKIEVQPDGKSATLTYEAAGKMTITQQADGSWSFHYTEIPPERIKFFLGINFPISFSRDGSSWSFDNDAPKPFPAEKGEVRLKIAGPSKFTFKKGDAGFTITVFNKTFASLTDQRPWGQDKFNLGLGYYYAGKNPVSETTYSLKIESFSPPPAP